MFDVLPGDVELDPGIDSGHCADGDGDVLAAQQVSCVQEHVGDPAAARIHGNSGDVPDIAVDGIDRVAAAHGHLSGRLDVIGESLGQAAGDTVGPGLHLYQVRLGRPGPWRA